MYYNLKHKKTQQVFPHEKDIVHAFKSSLSTYGRRKIQKELENKGIHVSQYMISKVLKKYDLEPKWGRPKLAKNIYTSPKYETSNLIKNTPKGLTIYAADMSEFRCKNGQKLIVSAIIDLTSRAIVGYTYSTNYKSDFVRKSFENAFEKFGVPNYVHTDNGPQYLSELVHKYILEKGAKHSFSKPGTPNDNQYIESFWRVMKTEIGPTGRMSIDDLKKVVDFYIDFYNNHRLHSSINYLPPLKFKKTL